MKKFFVLMIVLTALLGTFSVAVAQTERKCDQVFTLFDKTVGDHSLMFYRVDWRGGGMCGRGIFFTMFLLPDRVHSFQSTSLRGNWVGRFYANLPIEEYEILKDSNGVFRLNDTATFAAPPPDSALESLYDSLDRHDAKTWLWEYPRICSEIVFDGFSPEPIYRYPGGLYFGYQIREARYYRESNFLLLLTEQSRRDQNGRSMHGLMIYKVDGWEWLGQPPPEFRGSTK